MLETVTEGISNIRTPRQSWNQDFSCQNCGTEFTANQKALECDHFKKPGTNFFDGSADSAGMDLKFFVTCPSRCGQLMIVEESEIPVLLSQKVRRQLKV